MRIRRQESGIRHQGDHADKLPANKLEQKPLEDGDYYINEDGLMVFTAQYHLKRGYCCGSGCKHCPYEKGVRDKE